MRCRVIAAHSNGFHTIRALAILMTLLGTIDRPGGFRHKAPFPRPIPPCAKTPNTPLAIKPNHPLDGLALTERTLMRIARSVSGEPLPAASLCYVWDATLPAGTLLPNAFSARVRYLVVNGVETPPGRWVSHERRLSKDFLMAFGHEASSVPPLIAIALGADSDNTGGSSLGYVGDVTLSP